MEQEESKKEPVAVNAEKQKKATGFISRCFNYVYRAIYLLMALLIFLASLALIGSVLYATFHRADTNVTPTYKEYSAGKKAPVKEETKVDTTSIEINKKFGDELIAICKLTGIEKPDRLVDEISGIEEKHREAFVRGLLKFLKDAKEAEKDYKPEEQGRDLLFVYEYQFKENVNDVPRREAKAAEECKVAWCLALFALISLLFSLVLPLLIQIERNTRKD